MEEIKKNEGSAVAEEKEVKMIPVEEVNKQMQELAKQANVKLQQLGAHAQQVEAMLRDRTIDYLFKVVKYSQHFNAEFVYKCVSVIENYLTQAALTEPKPEEENTEKEG